MGQISMKLDDELLSKIKEQADKEDKSISQMIRVMIKEYLKDKERG